MQNCGGLRRFSVEKIALLSAAVCRQSQCRRAEDCRPFGGFGNSRKLPRIRAFERGFYPREVICVVLNCDILESCVVAFRNIVEQQQARVFAQCYIERVFIAEFTDIYIIDRELFKNQS